MQEYAAKTDLNVSNGGGTLTRAQEGQHSTIGSASLQIATGLSELGERLDGLRERLSPVLRPSEPHPMLADTSDVTRTPSEHTAELTNHARYLRELIDRVNDIAARLDV